MENVTIELQVNLGYGRKLIRSAIQPNETTLYEALQPIKTSSTPELQFLEGQYEMEQQCIRAAREELAKSIAESLTSHLLEQWLPINDTHNGYKKGE